MNNQVITQIESTLSHLFEDAKYDKLKMLGARTKSIFRTMEPKDFEEVYLSISQEQGKDLVRLIEERNIKSIVEFGTSFGISTLFLAQGALATQGNIITSELLETKANQATKNFETAGVSDMIEVKVGDALSTLADLREPIDLLFLDGWKDLYLPIFRMLESNFHTGTVIYVDNANMEASQLFLDEITKDAQYLLESQYDGRVVLVTKVK